MQVSVYQKDATRDKLPICDIWQDDPPYDFDTVNYDEISEFFIPWLKNSSKKDGLNVDHWESVRQRYKRTGEAPPEFEDFMTASLENIRKHTAEGGICILHFGHQHAVSWRRLIRSMVKAKWYIKNVMFVTSETTSGLKTNNNMQGNLVFTMFPIVLRIRNFIKERIVIEIDRKLKQIKDVKCYTKDDIIAIMYSVAFMILMTSIEGQELKESNFTRKLKNISNKIYFEACLSAFGEEYFDFVNKVIDERI